MDKETRKIAKKILDSFGIVESKRIHNIWNERAKLKEKNPDYTLPSTLGKFHYFFESDKGKISMISSPNYFKKGETLWEIYCLQGKLFEDTIRFQTEKAARKKIKELLT